MLRIFVLGSVRVHHDEPYREIHLTRTTQALLAYLILQGSRPCSRQVLAGVLWGDSDEASARSCLSTALWRLRLSLEGHKRSPASFLLSNPNGEIYLNPDCPIWVDALAFEAAVKPALAHSETQPQPAEIANLEKSLQLYQGDLLESFYEDWALSERERIRLLYLSAMECLMCFYQQHGELDRSLETGLQILRQDPLREDIHRAVMRLYNATGRRTQAVLQYEHCREQIFRELGIEPMPETRSLAASIQAGTSPAGELPTLVRASHSPQTAEIVQQATMAIYLDAVQRQLLQTQQALAVAQQQLSDAVDMMKMLHPSNSL